MEVSSDGTEGDSAPVDERERAARSPRSAPQSPCHVVMATRAVTSTMIAFVLILLIAGWPTGGQTGLVRFYESVPDHLQPDRRIPINDYAMHGPIVDDHEFPRDLREPYPGKSFGPMGPIDGSLPDDVSFRSLSSGQEKGANSIELLSSHAVEKIEKHKPEYKIMSVEFHRVETPFVIGIWIFFASIAKIGMEF